MKNIAAGEGKGNSRFYILHCLQLWICGLTTLSSTDRAVMRVILLHYNVVEGAAFASVHTYADEARFTERCIRETLTSLIAKGALTLAGSRAGGGAGPRRRSSGSARCSKVRSYLPANPGTSFR